jgi:hypothetical protein
MGSVRDRQTKGHKLKTKNTHHTIHMALHLIKKVLFPTAIQRPIWSLLELSVLGDYPPSQPPEANPGNSSVRENRVLTRIFGDKKEEDAKY